MERVVSEADGRVRLKLCWAIIIVWLAAVLAAAVWPKSSAAALSPLLFLIFILVHGSLSYGWKGIGLYFVIGIPIGFIVEASSIAYGFPFGYYVHFEPGPKPLGVPIIAMLAYAVLGLPAWTLARLIIRRDPAVSRGNDVWTTPLIATFVTAGIDLVVDPVGSTVGKQWAYRFPSGLFGVPLTNFLGWLFTGWLIFQLFALFERRFGGSRAVNRRDYWLIGILIWLGQAIPTPFQFASAPSSLTHAGSRAFVTSDVYETSLIISLFTIVFAALLGLARLIGNPPAAWDTDAGPIG